MRVLLVAPGMSDINAIPEMRTITEIHEVHVLSGRVTWGDFLQACRAGKRDIIHFATHSNSQHLELSDGSLTPEHISQAARMTKARLIFFNSCESSRHAAFAVRNGIEFAIHTTIAVPDNEAWQTPLAFYEYLRHQETLGEVDIPIAFMSADAGDGTYGLYRTVHSQSGMREIVEEMEHLREALGDLGLLRAEGTGRSRQIRVLFLLHIAQWVSLFIYAAITATR